ncbi:MAG: DUF1016 N-terminal domain-containing protein [Peptostreptococcaceae bacterium]|nr:DUF1016 N-terminal domain-containing protein [Peptostreptococcaceae bacterium]
MKKKENSLFLDSICSILENARKRARTAVNLSMVYAYYEIGRKIIEEEQNGDDRAGYGQNLLLELSEHLTQRYGKGFSADNLKLMRRFYQVYSKDRIGETLFPQFEDLPSVGSGRKFYLSWSHYLKLMRIENIEERHFYEIESIKNDWSLSELKRQFSSSLYDSQIFASKYETVLPKKADLKKLLEAHRTDPKEEGV